MTFPAIVLLLFLTCCSVEQSTPVRGPALRPAVLAHISEERMANAWRYYRVVEGVKADPGFTRFLDAPIFDVVAQEYLRAYDPSLPGMRAEEWVPELCIQFLENDEQLVYIRYFGPESSLTRSELLVSDRGSILTPGIAF